MLSHKPVLTKKDFARRYAKGEFGNRPPTWDSFEDWWAAVADDEGFGVV